MRWSCNCLFIPGDWFGVEWDDSSRGRHDGTKDGVRYFHCRLANKLSFRIINHTRIIFPANLAIVVRLYELRS